MPTVDVKLNRSGMRDLLKSEAVRADLERRARAIAERAGGAAAGFESSATVGHSRALAMAWTESFAAMKSEAQNATLTRAIDAARQ